MPSNAARLRRTSALCSIRSISVIGLSRNWWLYNLTELEDRQIHRNHQAADKRSEHGHDDGFHETGQAVDRIVHFSLVVGCALVQHGVQCTRPLTDTHHLSDHHREERSLANRKIE